MSIENKFFSNRQVPDFQKSKVDLALKTAFINFVDLLEKTIRDHHYTTRADAAEKFISANKDMINNIKKAYKDKRELNDEEKSAIGSLIENFEKNVLSINS